MHAPLSAFNAIALEYPVFRIDPITEKDQKDCDAMPALRFSNRVVRRWWFVGCCAFGVAFGAPAFAADAENGKTIAERWCSSCHVVQRNQSLATDQAPPFASLAKMPDFSANKLAFLLLKPHPNMPTLSLSRTEVANLAEYIATLK